MMTIMIWLFVPMTWAFHFEIFQPNIKNWKTQYIQGLSYNDRSLLVGTNCGCLIQIGKNPAGVLEQRGMYKIGKKSVQKIHSSADSIVARMESDDFEERPFGESIIIDGKTKHTLFRLNHDCSHLVYDAMIGPHSYLSVYANGMVRTSVWNSELDVAVRNTRLYETRYKIGNIGKDEHIHLAFHSQTKLYVITSQSRFGYLDEQYAFHELHNIGFLGLPTCLSVNQPREDTIFVYIGTSIGIVYFLHFNGRECLVRNQLQICSVGLPITQVTSNQGQSIYASTTDCRIVGFNMISFDRFFYTKTGYDQFQFNTDNFIVKKNSVITYDNMKRLICFIL